MSSRKKPDETGSDGNGAGQTGQPDAASSRAEHASEADQAQQQTTNESTSTPGSGTSDAQALGRRVAELEEELASLKDQYLRKQADLENFRKRINREKEEAIAFANRQLLLDLVTVIDDFERAILSAEESRDFDSFHDGIVLIEKQLVGMLERKWGLKRFDSAGEPFDPQLHEALMTEESPEHDESMVLEDFQKGYLLHDKVLRSAKVKVSLPAAQS